jgi:hypothetical protein
MTVRRAASITPPVAPKMVPAPVYPIHDGTWRAKSIIYLYSLLVNPTGHNVGRTTAGSYADCE